MQNIPYMMYLRAKIIKTRELKKTGESTYFCSEKKMKQFTTSNILIIKNLIKIFTIQNKVLF